MFKIVEKRKLAENIYEMKIAAERVARAALPGQFVIVRSDENGERIPLTIADYDVDEEYFLKTLDEMTEQAFDDQCTGANPRYPLMSEIKQMYLNAYYGNNKNAV